MFVLPAARQQSESVWEREGKAVELENIRDFDVAEG